LVNAHTVKNVSGRKDDDSNIDWIRQVHSYGLLRGSFQPEDNIRALRAYLRDRDTLSELASPYPADAKGINSNESTIAPCD